MFTEVSTSFVDELQLDESQRFGGRLGQLGLASAAPLAHLRNLDVLCHLIDLL